MTALDIAFNSGSLARVGPSVEFGTRAETQLAGHPKGPAGFDAGQLGFGVCPELAPRAGAGLQYQHEEGSAPPLLFDLLHPELKRQPGRAQKFKAQRSLLWSVTVSWKWPPMRRSQAADRGPQWWPQGRSWGLERGRRALPAAHLPVCRAFVPGGRLYL
jgi:hypothetical protein